ncbi:MAG TPA: hypothetical protein VII52_09040 [Gemmatimonadaceae bacterium]
MPALTVRAAQPDDLDLVVELRLALLREYRAHPLYAGLRSDARHRARELYHSQLTSAFETIFLAEQGGQVSGLLRCGATASPVAQQAWSSLGFEVVEQVRRRALQTGAR